MNETLKIERARKSRGLGPMLPADWSAHFKAREAAATMRPVFFQPQRTVGEMRALRRHFDIAAVLP